MHNCKLFTHCKLSSSAQKAKNKMNHKLTGSVQSEHKLIENELKTNDITSVFVRCQSTWLRVRPSFDSFHVQQFASESVDWIACLFHSIFVTVDTFEKHKIKIIHFSSRARARMHLTRELLTYANHKPIYVHLMNRLSLVRQSIKAENENENKENRKNEQAKRKRIKKKTRKT